MNLSLNNITVKYNTHTVIDDVTLTIKRGEFLALLGRSGSGKTTLVNALCGLVPLNHGTILDESLALHNLPIEKRPFGVVFQHHRLFPHLNVAQNIAFSLKMNGASKAQQQDRVSTLLDEVGLNGFEKRSIKSLSGGQKQRVAIARAIAVVPKLLILDEAFASLDDDTKNNMHSLITDLHQKEQLTTMLITHDIGEALTLSNRVLHLKDGKITFDAAPRDLIKHKDKYPIIENWVKQISNYQKITKPLNSN